MIAKGKNIRELPTRKSLYNLKEKKLIREMNLEEYELNALFSNL